MTVAPVSQQIERSGHPPQQPGQAGPLADASQLILASASYDHTIRFWDPTSGMCLRTVQHQDSQVNAMAITPDRKFLAAAGYQHIRMYDLQSTNANPVVNFEGIGKNVTAIGFHADNRWMYTGGEDNSAKIWDLRSRQAPMQLQRIFQVNSPVSCVCLHPNQSELFIGDQNGTLYLWDLRNDHNEQLLPEQGVSIQHVCVDQQGTMLAAVNSKGHCFIWNLIGGIGTGPQDSVRLVPKCRFDAHKKYALKCYFSPDSTLLATTSADRTIQIFRTADFTAEATPIMTLKHDAQRWVWDAAFSNDSQYLFSCSSDNLVRLWRLETGDVVREFAGHQKAVTALAFKDVESV